MKEPLSYINSSIAGSPILGRRERIITIGHLVPQMMSVLDGMGRWATTMDQDWFRLLNWLERADLAHFSAFIKEVELGLIVLVIAKVKGEG